MDAIVHVVNRIRDQRPEDAILIFDESVYFLDILAVALRTMYEPVLCFEFNGRTELVDRQFILEDFLILFIVSVC